jgi:membrane-bound serine protease (ClpP class)
MRPAALLDIPLAEAHSYIINELRNLEAPEPPIAAMFRNESVHAVHQVHMVHPIMKLVLFLVALALATPAESAGLIIPIDGAIGPATAREVKEGLAAAAERRADIVILRLNTPGGLVTSMREIIADVIASPIPVVGYVAPSGAHAASAGTYILYATNIAAMAPGTNIGAATPVEIGGPLPGMPDEHKDDKSTPSTSADPMAAKATNDAVAFIRSLAELRGRNAEWAEKAVREAASLSAEAALKEHVIDLIAADETELLARIDGRTIGTHLLATKGLALETYEPGWLITLLALITDPNIAVILMLLGVYGIIFEFTSPGMVAPGVIGTISLLLAFYAFNLLPIDLAGLALMLLGIAFLIVEAYSPTFVLGAGGIIAFLLGAAMLFKTEAPVYRLSATLIAVLAALLFGLTTLIGRYVWAARNNPVRAGAETMRGALARILDWRGNMGHVLAEGERWQALGEGAFTPGDTVVVRDVNGLTLRVEAKHKAEGEIP